MYYFIATILSLPKSPFSILFHDPSQYNDCYVAGMPEDEASQLFKALSGSGLWLCPNDHLYFVGGCSWTRVASTCVQCGAPTGNEIGKGTHTPAPGNRRIGKIGPDGKIIVE